MQNLTAAVDRINAEKSVQDLYKKFGISTVEPEAPKEVEELTSEELVNYSAVIMGADYAKYAATVQRQIGAPGTNISDGKIEVEHNYRLLPYFARGRTSSPGEFERVYRTEPIAFKSLNEIGALICNATYDVSYPDGIDAKTRELAEAAHQSIMHHREGMPTTLNAMSTAFRNGFAPFEPVWKQVDGQWLLHALPFREQSTVDRWLFNKRMDTLVGCEFQTKFGMGGANRYVLPNNPNRPGGKRLLVVNINATGNNVEGVSPVRVVVGLRKLKELILQISGVSHQKYGVPIAVIVRELANASASDLPELGSEANRGILRKIVTRLQNMRATIAPVIDMPIGTTLDYKTPTNDMPDVRPLLEYLDTMMALCFHNEGALLGSQSFGSYAMASVSDSKFMRAAPVYASRVADALTELLHCMIRWNHPDGKNLIVLPRYTFRFAGTQDSTRWVNDMAMLVQSKVWEWPDEARRMAAANMGLKVEAFDDWAPSAEIAASMRRTEEEE